MLYLLNHKKSFIFGGCFVNREALFHKWLREVGNSHQPHNLQRKQPHKSYVFVAFVSWFAAKPHQEDLSHCCQERYFGNS
jgi:hypothetical protein